MFKITGTLLEVAPVKEFQGSKYSSIVLRSADVADNSLLRYKLDLKSVDYDALVERLDTEIQANVVVERGANQSAMLRVVDFK